MKKLLYLIPPLIATAAFLVLYSGEVHKKAAKDAAAKTAAAAKLAADDAKKKEDDAIQLASMAEKAKAKKAADELAVQKKADEMRAQRQRIADDTAESASIVNAKTAEIAALEKDVKNLRDQREQLNHDYIEASKVVEGLKAQQGVADLEIERALAMIDAQTQAHVTLSLPVGWVPDSIPGSKGIPPAGLGPKKQAYADEPLPDDLANGIERAKERAKGR